MSPTQPEAPGGGRPEGQRFVDAYLWFGRAWMFKRDSPYQPERAAQFARSTPW